MERSTTKKLSTLATLIAAGLVASSIAAPTLAQQVDRGAQSIVVLVRNLRSDRGHVIAGLYTSSGVWLAENHAASDCHAPIRNGEARCVFAVPATARVAFAGMHDEDGDGEFDRDMLGLPQEGYAFSNDVREPFGPPSFEAAAFNPPAVRPFVVHVRYGI